MIYDKSILSRSTILVGADRSGNSDYFYGTHNEHNNTQNNVIEGGIRREMTVDTDQKHQEKVEASANIIYQLKQRDRINKRNDNMDIPSLGGFPHVSSYPLIESMGFDTDIYDGVARMRAATHLGDIFRLHQRTKNLLEYVHTNSKYGHLIEIPASYNQESFSISARGKGWVDEILLRLSGGEE